MTQRIQQIPAGLLDLLDIFGGNNPDGLMQEVRGVVDLTPMYLRLEQITEEEAVVGGQPNGAELAVGLVPAGQYWWIKSMSCWASAVNTTTTFGFRCFLRAGGVGFATRFGSDRPPFTLNNGRDYSIGTQLDVLVPPGSQFGTVLEAGVAGNMTIRTTVTAARLRF